jgi:hypothetical protein
MNEAMKDIHDIRPPMMVGMDPAMVKLGLAVGAGLLLLLVVILMIRHFWKKRKPVQQTDVTAQIVPYDAAVKALDRLALDPVRDAKIFYFDLGHTVKAYMGGTYGFNGLEMTTQELIRALRSLDISGDLKLRISSFQELCDPFRYAPVTPDKNQVTTDLALARDLVEALEAEVRLAQNSGEEKS